MITITDDGQNGVLKIKKGTSYILALTGIELLVNVVMDSKTFDNIDELLAVLKNYYEDGKGVN